MNDFPALAHNPAWYTRPDSQTLEGDVLFPVTVTTRPVVSAA